MKIVLTLMIVVVALASFASSFDGGISIASKIDQQKVSQENAAFEVIPVYECQTLDIEGRTYILQNDITTDGACFTIFANNVTLDMNNHSITGNGDGWAIEISNYDSLTVKNGGIYNFNKGIRPVYSDNNIFINNEILGNNDGIDISYSNNNIILNNHISSNFFRGIGILNNVSNNIVKGNHISNNGAGIYFSLSSNKNIIYNNYFSNEENIDLGVEENSNSWNIDQQEGENIVGGPHLGGNYWAKPDGTGFSQTCEDSNEDGFCDKPYFLAENNTDYLPLTDFVDDVCVGDVNEDWNIDGQDLIAVLGAWGSDNEIYDLDGDGVVGQKDLDLLLENWGVCTEKQFTDVAITDIVIGPEDLELGDTVDISIVMQNLGDVTTDIGYSYIVETPSGNNPNTVGCEDCEELEPGEIFIKYYSFVAHDLGEYTISAEVYSEVEDYNLKNNEMSVSFVVD